MNTDSRQLLNARIAELLHAALVDIRSFTYLTDPGEPDRRTELNDLADLLHNLPRYLVGHDEYAIDSIEQLRDAVLEHVKRFNPGADPQAHHYVQLLDMDAETFLHQYRDHQWGEAEPVSAVQ